MQETQFLLRIRKIQYNKTMEGYYNNWEEINERRGRLEAEFEKIFPKPEAPYEETARKITNESLKGYKPTSAEDATLSFMSSYFKSMLDAAVVERAVNPEGMKEYDQKLETWNKDKERWVNWKIKKGGARPVRRFC